MADNIKGITIEIGGDVSPLNKALGEVNKESRSIQNELKSVERLLKLDPSNTELVAQKQKLLGEAVEKSREKLDYLKKAQAQVEAEFKNGNMGETEYRAFQRQVISAEQALKSAEDAAEDAGKKAKKSGEDAQEGGSGWEKFGNMAAGATKIVVGAVGAGATAMTALTQKSLDATGELEQNMGGSEAVFKESAESMQKTAEEAYSNMGLSASDFMATANKMGALFQGSGFEIEESADLSSKAMQRAADVASIMGLDVSAAMEAVAGAAKGNFTMMDNLGVAMNDTAIKAYAAEKGLVSMTEAEKAFAAIDIDLAEFGLGAYSIGEMNQKYNELVQTALNGTGEAMWAAQDALQSVGISFLDLQQKDPSKLFNKFVDGAEKAANEIGNTKLDLTNQEKISLAMEMFLEKTSYAAGNYAKENETLAGSLTTAKAGFDNFLAGTGSIDGLVDSLVSAAGVIIENVEAIVPQLVDGITKIIELLVPQLPPLLQALLPGLIEGAVALVSGLVSALPTITNALLVILPMLLSGLQSIITALIQALPTVVQSLVAATPGVITQLVNAIIAMLPVIVKTGIQLLISLTQGLIDAIPQLLEALPTIISALLDGILSAIPQLIEAGIQLLTALVTALPDIIQKIVEVLPDIITAIIDALLMNLPLIVQAGIDLLVALIQALPQIITTIVAALPKIITSIIDALIGNIDKIILAGVQLLVALVENTPKIIVEVVKAIPKIVKGMIDAFISYVPKMAECGLNLIKGLWNGIKDAGAWLWDKISGFFGGIMDKIKGFFGINSPSTLFRDMIGKNLVKGISVGVDVETPNLQDDLQNNLSSVAAGLQTTIDTETAKLTVPGGGAGGVNLGGISFNIEKFYNSTDKGMRQLVEEGMEAAEEYIRRRAGAFA